MGIVVVDSTADFSAANVGHVTGLSVTSGLQNVWVPHLNESTGTRNLMVDGAVALVSGSPTWNSDSVTTSTTGKIIFPSTLSGSHTVAVCFHNEVVNANMSYIGAYLSAGDSTTNGAWYFKPDNYNLKLMFRTTDSSAKPWTVSAEKSVTIAAPGNAFIVCFVRFTDTVGVTVDVPGQAKTYTTSDTEYFGFDYTSKLGIRSGDYMSAYSPDVSFCAAWNRVLTDQEVADSYLDIRHLLSKIGLSV